MQTKSKPRRTNFSTDLAAVLEAWAFRQEDVNRQKSEAASVLHVLAKDKVLGTQEFTFETWCYATGNTVSQRLAENYQSNMGTNMQTESKAKETNVGSDMQELLAASESRGRAQGARDAYADLAEVLEAWGVGQEDVTINGSDAVGYLADLYGRAQAGIGIESYALQHTELLVGDAAPAVVPEPQKAEGSSDLGQVCRAGAELLKALAAGDIDAHTLRGDMALLSLGLLSLGKAIDLAMADGRQERQKAEATSVLQSIAHIQTQDEVGAGGVDLADRADLLDALIEQARKALARRPKAEGRGATF